MKNTLLHIASRKQDFALHPLFAWLERPELDRARTTSFVPFMTFWVLAFQDIIRLNAHKARDPAIRAILDEHVREDTGHDEWFLEDVEQTLDIMEIEVRWLFSSATMAAREYAYAIMSEVYRVEHDHLRLVLVEALEATAQLSIGSISRSLALVGHGERLKYFAPSHLKAEESHQMFEEALEHRIRAMEFSDEVDAQAVALIDRVFGAFTRMADELLARATSSQ